MKSNPDLAASSYAVESGKASYKGSFNGLLPQISLSNSAGESAAARSQSWQAQASASLNLFDAGQMANIKVSKASLAQATASLRQTSANLRYSLRNAFLKLLFSQENVEISRRIIDLRARSAKLVSLRYDAGTESRGNMLRAQAELLQAQVVYDQALADLRTSQKNLDRQLGWDDFRTVTATGTLDIGGLPTFPTIDDSMFANVPDIAVQEAAVKSSLAGLEQSKSSLFPALSASYSRSRAGTAEFPASQYGWTAGATLSYPLFSGGLTATYYAVSAAQRNVEKARASLRSAREQAVVNLEGSWANWFKAAGNVKIDLALLESARQRNIEGDIRYNSGLLTYDNWEIISSDRVSQERQLLTDRLNAALSEAAWGQALGKALGE